MTRSQLPSRRRLRALLVLGMSVALTSAVLPWSASPASAGPPAAAAPTRADLPKVPVMVGTGGAVSSVDRDASQIGIDVLARGGNAADAAVATAAALGVTEPYSAGIGGGGFLVYFDAATKKVTTIDGREAAPASFTETTFIGPDGAPLPFAAAVSSGLSVGVPGTPALWDKAARTLGTKSLGELLRPAEELARGGFVVDQTYASQTAENQARFSLFPETVRVFLPGGAPPAVGSTVTNPDLAKAYRELRTEGVSSLYAGRLGRALVNEARTPSTAPGASVYPGQVTMADLRAYRAPVREPTHARYRGYDVYGMGVPSSGGIAVGEILNLVQSYEERTGLKLRDLDELDYLHWFSEASATAFADRNRYVGDVPGVPVDALLRQRFADERACLFDPAVAQPRPLPFGDPERPYTSCAGVAAAQVGGQDVESTTHLTVADRWGNVAAYTLTIEQTGGSGITVPGWGFLLNNELTDFSFAPLTPGVPDPNLPGPGKRPRSSMSPTIVVRDGTPVVALGSPGGATIITSVAQTLLGHLDRDLPLVDAIAAARLSSRNGRENAEPAITDTQLGAGLTARGHVLVPTPEIGAVAAVQLLPGGRFVAAAETVRRGGGSAMVVHPRDG
jgi:gamma-glutamyltranspeptidase/glutathione hydrolase